MALMLREHLWVDELAHVNRGIVVGVLELHVLLPITLLHEQQIGLKVLIVFILRGVSSILIED